MTPIVILEGTGAYVERVSMDGETQDVERVCHVEAALRWAERADSHIACWVNTVPTPDGGTHFEGFCRGVVPPIRAALKTADLKKLRKAESGPGRDDCLAGLVAAVRVKVPEPLYSITSSGTLSKAITNSGISVMRSHRMITGGGVYCDDTIQPVYMLQHQSVLKLSRLAGSTHQHK